jgi:hypothetical protein
VSKKKPTIFDRWGITVDDFTELVDRNGSLRGIVIGYIAELKLRKLWFERKGVIYHGKSDDHDRLNKGDLIIEYRGNTFSIESKSLQTKTIKFDGHTYTGGAQCDGSDRRTIKLPDGSSINTTLLLYDEFDLLAVNIFGFGNQWRFLFARNKDLPHSTWRGYTPEQQKHLIASMVKVSYPPQPPFRDEPFSLLDEIIEERERGETPKPLVIGDKPATLFEVELPPDESE